MMKNDNKIRAKMKCLETKVKDWNLLVKQMSNQDAYTDRCLEEILGDVDEIQRLYKDGFREEGSDEEEPTFVVFEIVKMYKDDHSIEHCESFEDIDDARAVYINLIQDEAESLEYAVLRKIEISSEERIEEIALYGIE